MCGVVRRCPTLPHPSGCSTIGAVGLSFRVRDGTGRFPHAMTAVTLVPDPRGRRLCAGLVGVGKSLWCSARGGRYSIVVPVHRTTVGLLVGSRIVDAVFCGVPTMGPRRVSGGGGVWCKLSAY